MVMGTDVLEGVATLVQAALRAAWARVQGLSPDELFVLLGAVLVLLIFSQMVPRLVMIVLAMLVIFSLLGGLLGQGWLAAGRRAM